MPPLPERPVVDAKDAELKSKKYLGLTSKTLIGDELHKDCRQLERCVTSCHVADHISLGYSVSLVCMQERSKSLSHRVV